MIREAGLKLYSPYLRVVPQDIIMWMEQMMKTHGWAPKPEPVMPLVGTKIKFKDGTSLLLEGSEEDTTASGTQSGPSKRINTKSTSERSFVPPAPASKRAKKF